MRRKVKGRARALLAAAGILLGAAGCGQAASPAAASGAGYPAVWPMDGAGPERNAAFAAGPGAPAGLQNGYRWRFAEVHALPLDRLPPETPVVGRLRASVRITQTLGNALGVSVVQGTVYAESDSGAVYALDAADGRPIWQRTLTNQAMGNPVVVGGRVFVGTGNSDFSYRELVHYRLRQPVMRGTGLSAVYALSARTGRTLWRYDTAGEDMPTPAYLNGVLYEANGHGNVFALDAASGRLLWKTHVGGFDSMSSPVAWLNPVTRRAEVLASFSDPNQVVALDGADGKVLWRQGIAGGFDTGVGDEVPAVAPRADVAVVSSVVDPKTVDGRPTANLAMEALNAADGHVLWYDKFGRGPMPPAFKAGIPMIHGGIVYFNAPATDTMHAVALNNGHILWSFRSGFPGRAAPTYYEGRLYFADGPYIWTLDPKNGHLLGRYKAGGLFGIVNPVIVGGTMFLDNSYNWVMALPLKTINASA